MSFRRLVPLALLLLLSGCGLFESRAERALRTSPDYKAGYGDGCNSSGARGVNSRDNSLDRDEEAYQGNPAYRQGWNSGFGACRPLPPSGAGNGSLTNPNGAFP